MLLFSKIKRCLLLVKTPGPQTQKEEVKKKRDFLVSDFVIICITGQVTSAQSVETSDFICLIND